MKQTILFLLILIMTANAVNAFVICDMSHETVAKISADMPCHGKTDGKDVEPVSHLCDCDNCVQQFYSLSLAPTLAIPHGERASNLSHQHINPFKHKRLRPPIHFSS